MIEDNDIEQGEIDPDELRRRLADMGMPLTPNVVNADNAWLEPIGGWIGHVSEVNGRGAEELPGFVPTRHELCLLVKYWMTEVIDFDFSFFCFEQTCSIGIRRWNFGKRRIDRIAAFIGKDAVERAIDEAYEEYGRQQDSDAFQAWRVYLHGTEDERRAFKAKCDAALEVNVREHEDQFYASLLKFVAGEPHDIEPGTVGMARAVIAKMLVKENPALAAPENRGVLLKEIHDTEVSGH